MPGHNSPTSKPSPSRETSSLPTKLVEDFSSMPHQPVIPHCPQYSAEQTHLISEEVTELLQKGAIGEIVPVKQPGFYSNLFLVPKKDGGKRPVINLKSLNNFVNKEHFKMEGIHTLKDILRQGDWLAKIDLKDAFFSIPIHPSHRKFLRFIFKERAYQFNCLPFGLSSAPWVFTKTLKPALAILRERGVRLLAYIDDILILAESRDLILDQVTGMLYLLQCLGFIVNTKKSVLNPAQVIEFLGLSVDSVAMEIRLPPIKIKQIRAEARKLARQKSVSARMLAQLLGKMNATNCVLPPGPLFYRYLQMALTNTLEQSSQCYEAQVPLTQECLEELEWWDSNMCRWNGKTLVQRDIDLVIESDASLEGWGAHCSRQRTGGPWSQQERSMHINCLELLAATLATKTFAKSKTSISILLRIDNTTAVAYINNLGGTVSRELVMLTRNLWMWCLERNIHITAVHLPGALNTIADTESREMLDRTDWKLNPVIFQKITTLYGPLDMDLFASRLSTQCPHYFSWRPDPYALATDAFLQDWTAMKCYANPPWNLVGRVLAQVQSQQTQVVLVAPVWKAQPWFPTLLNMLIDHPRLIIPTPRKPISVDPMPLLPQLAVWHISGISSEVRTFQKKLQHCSSSHGGPKQTSPMTHCLENGIAGVLNGLSIHFLDLSAISSVHEKVDGYNVGQHPLISRLLKGIFHDRPPLPRYTSTWNVQTVLNYLEGLGENQSLPLKDLSWKLAMLLALTRPSRSADLSQLDLKRRVHKPDGVCFYPNVLAKQSRQGSQIAHFFFPSLPENPTLCPVMTLKAYEDRTKPIRDNEPRLFISFIKPYKAVTSSSVARWLKAVLTAAGIDTAIFSAHSTRGASSSAAAKVGITTNDILKAADWSSESVFQKFYYKPSDNPSYGRAVLSNSATNNTVDMRD
ncbi:uncharacterized protein [Dysidea avara]|uniref:uncharacterized protein n=1 Tax=Dysidea avara TaxID=196820 RepID=UPI0033339614